jgi:hypothetical protein
MTADHLPPRADLGSITLAGPDTFPFERHLSLRPLVNFWRGEGGADCGGAVCDALGSIVREAVARVPELEKPITNLAVLEQHADVVDALMAAVFAPAAWDQSYGAALMPFDLLSVYETPAFKQALLTDDRRVRGHVNLDQENLGRARLRHAYKVVLERVCGIKLELEYPLIVAVPDDATGLERHFRITFDSTFLDVHVVGERPPFSDADRARLHDYFFDVDRLLERLPPERFVIEGFTVVRAVDVTDQEVLSSIKRDLIDRESIVSHAKFQTLQTKLRTLFRRPDLHLSLAALDGDRVLLLNAGQQLEHSCIFADSKHHMMAEFIGTVYERTVKGERPIIVRDLAEQRNRHVVEDHLVASGTRRSWSRPCITRAA